MPTSAKNAGSTTRTSRPQPPEASENGSVMSFEGGVTLRTSCGHSFATCNTDRCFRLPPELRAERDRLLAAAQTEHIKRVTAEARRFAAEKIQINDTYINLAAEGAVDGWEQL
jgi:hypothetical protein